MTPRLEAARDCSLYAIERDSRTRTEAEFAHGRREESTGPSGDELGDRLERLVLD